MSGTPSATVVDEPKLERMSLRTMPESSSTLTPFEPSPGYGPPVSSGTSSTGPDAAAVGLGVAVALGVVAVADALAVGVVSGDAQAASRAVTPMPPKSPSARRRSTSVRMSYTSPRWSSSISLPCSSIQRGSVAMVSSFPGEPSMTRAPSRSLCVGDAFPMSAALARSRVPVTTTRPPLDPPWAPR